MSAIRMDMRCVSSGPLKTDSSAALRVSVLPDLDVTGEFCTRENVIETGTRGAEARHGRAQCEADRRPPATDRSRIWLATRKLARYGFPEICFLQFVAPVEPRESVGSAARISYDCAPLVPAIGPLCISVMMLTDGWMVSLTGLPALYAMVIFCLLYTSDAA